LTVRGKKKRKKEKKKAFLFIIIKKNFSFSLFSHISFSSLS